MRSGIVVLILGALTYFFVAQKRNEPAAPTAAPVAQAPAKHWPKQALDTTAKVKREVLRQRASNRVP